MSTLYIIYAFLLSTVFAISYIKIYKHHFELRHLYYLGVILFLLSIYVQLFSVTFFDLNIGYIALLSFITYPISLLLIFRTNIFNILFLSLNAILKVYISFIFVSALFANGASTQFTITWIHESSYYHLSQGNAYLFSTLTMYLLDYFLLKNKLHDFFLLKRNLLLIIFIQIILITNMIWISVSNVSLPFLWYNNILLLIAFSVDIIYFLLRLFTANSSYFSAYKVHSETLRKQLSFQIEHYKNYEEQTNEFLKFKHDYDKILKGISTLLLNKEYDAVKKIVTDTNSDLDQLNITYKKYSNNLILDALLNDYAKRFEKISASFSSTTYITLSNMTDIKILKLFYNILENSYEALLKVPNTSRRMIDIKSDVVENYVKISFVNTVNESSSIQLKTSKEDRINHGFGLSIINEIIQSYEGFSNRFITYKDGLSFYNLEIFLPLK